MRTLNLIKILEFYDVPQLFLAADKFGAKYICMMVRFDREIGFQYLSVQISDERLDAFISGRLDLRYLYLHPEVEDAFYKVVVRNQIINAERFDQRDITERILPEDGYYYEEDDDADNYELIQKTQQERFTIIRLGFIDHQNSHEIDTECLSQALSAFQHMVSNCHQKLRGKQNAIQSNLKVTTFKAASFDVEFKSSSPVDLFGCSDLSDTFATIDSLMRTDDEEEFKSILDRVRGRTVSSYKNFMKILEDNKLSIKYKWVSSIVDNAVVSNLVSTSRVSAIYGLLNRYEELSSEEVAYEGVFLASSVENGKWTMNADGFDKNISGDSETPSILSGVTIELKRYRIKCIEKIIQNVTTLKTENAIKIISIEEINH